MSQDTDAACAAGLAPTTPMSPPKKANVSSDPGIEAVEQQQQRQTPTMTETQMQPAAGMVKDGDVAEPQHHLHHQQGQGTPACAVPGEDAATSGYCLLQEGWVVAKVSDFGLSLCINPDETHVSSVHAVSLGAELLVDICVLDLAVWCVVQ